MSAITRLLVLCLLLFGGVAQAAEPVNVNSASAEAIASGMVGIGQAKAQAIVDYRKQHGPFKSVDDLLQVKGIGEKTLARNRERITAATAAAP